MHPDQFMLPQTQKQLEYTIEIMLYYNGKLQANWGFDIPPTSVQYQEPLRTNPQQGLTSGYVERFNAALPTLTVDWTTGTGPGSVGESSPDPDGYAHFLRLIQQIFRGYYSQTAHDVLGQWSMHFYDYPHQQFMEVVPLTQTWTHATPENLALSSTMTFVVLSFLTTNAPAPRTSMQAYLVDHPASYIQTIAQQMLLHASALGAYLSPTSLTTPEQTLFQQSSYATQWETADYQEWLTNPAVTNTLTNNLVTMATSTIPTLLDPVLNSPTLPYQVSLAQINQVENTLQSLQNQVNALTPTPYWVGSLVGNLVTDASLLTIAPQTVQP